MILKKSLRRGQASLEFFILLATILSFSLLSMSSFVPSVREMLYAKSKKATGNQGGYFLRVVDRLNNADEYPAKKK